MLELVKDNITLILSLKGSSITCELMEHFGCTKTLVSEPAFVKRRGRLLPEALETIFHLFVENTRASNRYKGFRLLAVDGSDLHTPTNPDDTASFIPGPAGQEPYNLQHLNALYDLCSHIYMDAIVQGRHQYDERRALCDMVDRANATSPAIIIADRGHESYNVFAHIQGKGWKFLIRVKDRRSNGIVNGSELPAQDEFDVPSLYRLAGPAPVAGQGTAIPLAAPTGMSLGWAGAGAGHSGYGESAA